MTYFHDGSGVGEFLRDGFRVAPDFSLRAFFEEAADEADAGRAGEFIQGPNVVGGGNVGAAGVAGVVAREMLEHDGGVFHGVDHGADGVQGPGKGEDAENADAPEGGLEADDAVVGGGAEDGAAGLGSHCAWAHAGGDGDGGAAAGTAGGVGGPPRIEGGRRVAGSELGGDGLAEDDCASLSQTGYGRGVVVGDEVGEDFGAGGGLQTGGIVDVLHAQGDAVEGGSGAGLFEFAV